MADTIDKKLVEKTDPTKASVSSIVAEAGKEIFESTVRPDWVRGNSTWIGDFVPGLGLVNYGRRLYDQVGTGAELFYFGPLLLYQIGTCYAIAMGLPEVLKLF
jgi:hypothetical protein